MSSDSQSLKGATIAFDLDGTLVDTAPDLIGALNVVLGERRLPALPTVAARILVGRGARALIERGFQVAGKALNEAEVPALVARFIDVYRSRIASESRPFEGVEAALDILTARGATLSVCTNKPTALSILLLESLGMAKRFASIVGADAAPAPKPDPRHLLHAIETAGGNPARAVMVGDSAADANAAKAANVPVILVPFGYTDIPAAELGADWMMDHFNELPALVEALLNP